MIIETERLRLHTASLDATEAVDAAVAWALKQPGVCRVDGIGGNGGTMTKDELNAPACRQDHDARAAA